MVRSMYSGVSGMKAHQSRMDVIGNNIANVNTYGFKGSRATFRDVYYQTLTGASGASSTAGGRNPSQVGYGSQMSSIDILMSRSSFQMTDNAMDLAIDGEGFFQVQDADGNKFYTRAGQLRFDAAGNLVDSQGNFVLGVSGNPLGRAPGADLIQLQIPPVEPSAASAVEDINDIKFTIKAEKNTKDGNVSMQFIPGDSMTDGIKAVANVGTSGIIITLNPNESFASVEELNNAVNQAINDYCMENNGQPHPAGKFTIAMEPDGEWPLTGEEICSTDFAMQSGKISDWPTDTFYGGFKPTTPADTGNSFSGTGAIGDFKIGYDDATKSYTVTMTIDNKEYEGTIDPTKTAAGKFKLANKADAEDYIVFDRPSYSAMNKIFGTDANTPPANTNDNCAPNDPDEARKQQAILDQIKANCTATAATESNALGLSSKKIMLKGGTVGGAQTINDLSGISIGPDGVITAQHASLGDITVGRIDLVTFANPAGLSQSGGTYFTTTANSGQMQYAQPGTDGSGQLATGSLETSNVDLSREFSDMIVTQRGFQANSRLITVSDEMLNELVNLKR